MGAELVLALLKHVLISVLWCVFAYISAVSMFDPDSRFISNVLSRLEGTMGIQIVSALTKVHSELVTRSGVKLVYPLPDPRQHPREYVEKVISQWSNGRSQCLPTWKELLDVFQSIGLQELSQQIEAFIKGKVKYMSAYHHFLNTRESLELLFLKFIFLGLPRLGKTTACRRLTGEIADLRSAGEAEQPQPSTGAVESGHNVVVRNLSNTTAVVTESEWSAIQNLTEEARMLFHNLVDTIENKTELTSSDAKRICSIPTTLPVSTVGENTESQFSVQPRQHSGTPRESTPISSPSSEAPVTSSEIPELSAIFREAMGSEYWKDVKHMFKAYLRMEDTGGQPELMDMLPALTIGPGIYLLFFSFLNELHSQYKVTYCSPSGETSMLLESTYTVEEMFLSALSSISCSNTSTSGVSSEKATDDPDLNKILESSKSVAYIVGTHKDKVSEQHIANFDQQLQEIIRSTNFFKKNIVQFCSEDRLVVAMDNMDGGTEEINEIRKLLEEGMKKHFKKLTIPAVWLLFSLCLRRRGVRTTSLESCLQLSEQFQMSPYETKVALWFLHHHAGVMMYFPNIPELLDVVIIDTQIVYDSVTILILRSLKFKEVGQPAAEFFRKTGQFSLEDLVAATATISGDHIPPHKLVALLEFLHIIARICGPQTSPSLTSHDAAGKVTYIMPCVLESASREELDSFQKDASHPLSVVPIMIRYKCGFVPIGVFPAMIACFIGGKSLTLIEKGIKKNCVQFYFGSDFDKVMFISRPKYYEIHLFRQSKTRCPPHKVCTDLREVVESTFETVSSRMNYGCFMDYQFSFECPFHTGREHLCVVERGEVSPHKMCCLQDRALPLPLDMQEQHLVWYGQALSIEGMFDITKLGDGVSSSLVCVPSISALSLLQWDDKEGRVQKLRILDEVSPKWKLVGDLINLSASRLEGIEMHRRGDVHECCRDVFCDWLKQEEGRYPVSWEGLCKLLEDLYFSAMACKLRHKLPSTCTQ